MGSGAASAYSSAVICSQLQGGTGSGGEVQGGEKKSSEAGEREDTALWSVVGRRN